MTSRDWRDDEWSYIIETRLQGRELTLTNTTQFKNDVMFEKDKRQWVEWLLKLPNMYVQTAAIVHIQKFEDWQESLVILFEVSRLHYHEKKKDIKLLATVFLYECFHTVEGSLHQLLEALSIINNELLTEIIQNALANIQIDALPQQKNCINVRKACIEHLSNDLNDSFQFFISKQTPTSLLVVMLLHFEVHDSKYSKEIWDAYLTVIEQNEHFWSYNLQKDLDDYKFLWLSAGILAQQNSPLESFKLAVNRINQPTEGWGIQNEELYKMDKRIVHLYIVGTMASEWLIAKEKEEEAVQLYNYVFHKTTDYLRNPITYAKDFIDLLISELWARLPLIKPFDHVNIALYTISLYDEYKHILLALTELYKNSHNKNDIKLLMKEVYEELFPLEKLLYAHNESILNWYEQFDWWLE